MPRRGRRKSAVPRMEWADAFGVWNMATAKVYDELNLPPVRHLGALFRQALNKYYIHKIYTALAANPGVETLDEVGEIIKKIIAENPLPEEFVAKYVRSQVKDERLADLYAKAIIALWKRMADKLPAAIDEAVQKIKEANEENIKLLEALAQTQPPR